MLISKVWKIYDKILHIWKNNSNKDKINCLEEIMKYSYDRIFIGSIVLVNSKKEFQLTI